MEYEKGYKGFIIWIIMFCVACVGVCFVPGKNAYLLARLVDNVCTLGIAIIALMIYINEKVYWYTGITYEEALRAGSERRKTYALKHLKRFGCFAIIFLIYSIIAHMMGVHIGIDIVVLLIGMVGVAISTITIRL